MGRFWPVGLTLHTVDVKSGNVQLYNISDRRLPTLAHIRLTGQFVSKCLKVIIQNI